MRVSVTSLMSYDKCPRLWGFQTEGWGEHEEQWPGMLQGSVVHDDVHYRRQEHQMYLHLWCLILVIAIGSSISGYWYICNGQLQFQIL